ncbi:MAG: putative lipid II flippase FtsW [Vicinamibacterales bacterium]|jgi:cell division protein FtsW|nr:putative lipid II flippase FtsW [Vicinamibacterales bacterium]MDP7480821.1 putative lipid II flippase FtsW [Vicinamibacterales bacterium]HJN42649.1 putative lipid II flippase FtsW [Vicinamibacterales bacterium]
MARKLKSDKLLFLATLLLVCASVVMVYSASAVLAMDRYQQPPYYFLFKQVTWAVLGVCLLSLAMRVDYRSLKQPVVIWTALGVSTAALIIVFFMPAVNGTRRWFSLGGIGVQPSELAKVAVIIFTAGVLERRMDKIDQLTALVPIAAVTGLVCGLIVLEPDFGTAFTVLLIVAVMVFAAGLHYRYLVGLTLVVAPFLVVVLASAEYRRRRLLAFLDPWADPLGDGFQIIQSMIAVGTGGVFGQGLMAGVQKLFYLPAPHTDFIYAVIAEETGLLGASAVLLCFGVIVWRGLRITAAAPDRFGAFLALGLTMMVAFQAFVNISVVLGLMPTKGIPLPFLSFGGSSLLISLLGMGMLLNVSQHASADA